MPRSDEQIAAETYFQIADDHANSAHDDACGPLQRGLHMRSAEFFYRRGEYYARLAAVASGLIPHV